MKRRARNASVYTPSVDTPSVPCIGEDILVQYELPSGKTVWWPVTIESVNPSYDSDELALASVLYHRFHGYPAESGEVKFMRERTVRTRVSTWADSSWRYTDEEAPHNSTKQTRGKADAHTPTAPISTPTSSSAQGSKKSRRSPSLQRTSSQRRTGSEGNRVRAPESDGGNALEVYIESKFFENRVKSQRVAITDEILRHASLLPRPRPTDNCAAYATALCIGSTTYKFKMDYDMFMYLSMDICKSNLPDDAVMHVPSGTDMVGRTARLQRHIIFRTAGYFFDWLGITTDMNRRNIVVEDRDGKGHNGAQWMRVMGAVRRSEEDGGAIHIHVGRSVSNTPLSSDNNGGTECNSTHEGEVIAYADSTWDAENGDFATFPSVHTGAVGDLSENCLDSTFSLTWDALQPLTKGKYSVTPYFSEGVQNGWVTVRYPYVLLRGRGTCNAVRNVLDSLRFSDVI